MAAARIASAIFGIGILVCGLHPEKALADEPSQSTDERCAFEQADIYLTEWSRLHRIGITIDGVKQGYSARVLVKDVGLIAELYALLRLQATGESCKSLPCDSGDFRLVIEFSGATCNREFAGEFGRVVNMTAGTWGKIDEGFRRRFTLFGLGRHKNGSRRNGELRRK